MSSYRNQNAHVVEFFTAAQPPFQVITSLNGFTQTVKVAVWIISILDFWTVQAYSASNSLHTAVFILLEEKNVYIYSFTCIDQQRQPSGRDSWTVFLNIQICIIQSIYNHIVPVPEINGSRSDQFCYRNISYTFWTVFFCIVLPNFFYPIIQRFCQACLTI